jgi:hypothetical protein
MYIKKLLLANICLLISSQAVLAMNDNQNVAASSGQLAQITEQDKAASSERVSALIDELEEVRPVDSEERCFGCFGNVPEKANELVYAVLNEKQKYGISEIDRQRLINCKKTTYKNNSRNVERVVFTTCIIGGFATASCLPETATCSQVVGGASFFSFWGFLSGAACLACLHDASPMGKVNQMDRLFESALRPEQNAMSYDAVPAAAQMGQISQ